MVFAHCLAAAGSEVRADRLVAGLIDAQEYFEPGQAGDVAIVVGPVRRVVELRPKALYCWMVLVYGIDHQPGLEEVRVAVKVATREFGKPLPWRLVYQGGMQRHDAPAS